MMEYMKAFLYSQEQKKDTNYNCLNSTLYLEMLYNAIRQEN